MNFFFFTWLSIECHSDLSWQCWNRNQRCLCVQGRWTCSWTGNSNRDTVKQF